MHECKKNRTNLKVSSEVSLFGSHIVMQFSFPNFIVSTGINGLVSSM